MTDFHPEISALTVGYMPLLDSAPLLWAQHRGYFREAGLEVTLAREVSWASLRDRLAYGALDAAQCLAPMPVAATLGADQVGVPLQTGLTLSQNWAAITFSRSMADRIGLVPGMGPLESAYAVAAFVRQGGQLRLAHVFQFSMHHYLLREWLALGGIAGDVPGISFSVVPPAQMVRHLENGAIDGFCVGEPWNTAAVMGGLGVVITTTAAIWDGGADKVLGVTAAWAEKHPQAHRALIAAVLRAQQELVTGSPYDELVTLMQQWRVLDVSPESLLSSLRGAGAGLPPRFAAGLDAFPRRSQLLWCAMQMLRWGQWNRAIDTKTLAARVCDAAAFNDAAAALGLPVLAVDAIREGEGATVLGRGGERVLSRFVDGSVFDVQRTADYLAGRGVSPEKAKALIY